MTKTISYDKNGRVIVTPGEDLRYLKDWTPVSLGSGDSLNMDTYAFAGGIVNKAGRFYTGYGPKEARSPVTNTQISAAVAEKREVAVYFKPGPEGGGVSGQPFDGAVRLAVPLGSKTSLLDMIADIMRRLFGA